MGSYILAIDQSTTTTKAIIFDRQGEVKGRRDVNRERPRCSGQKRADRHITPLSGRT